MQKPFFVLLLKEKTFTIPTIFKHAFDISPDIYNYMIFDKNHSYTVNSNVSEEVFQSFVKYLVNDEQPNIILENIHEYIELSQEFNLLDDIISEKKKLFGECLVNLMSIRQRESPNISKYEEGIASKLDEYIEKYGKNLMHLPIQTLFNIFNHKNRSLDNHNIAYDFVKQCFQETNNSSVFVLLSTLEGSKLTKANLSEAISLKDERLGYMTNIDFSYLTRMISKEEEFESQLGKFSGDISSCQEKFENEIKILKSEHLKEIQNLEKKHIEEIELLKNRIKENEEKHTKEVEALNQKITNQLNQKEEMLKIEIESLKKIISENDEKYEKRNIELNQNVDQKSNQNEEKFKEEIKLLTQKIDENEIKCQNQTETSNGNVNDFIVKLDLKESGIFESLKKKEKNHFDRLIAASQSSCDIYNLIDPNTKDEFCTTSQDNFYIEFELEKAVTVTGIKIISSSKYFMKSFDIIIDDENVYTTNNAEELNGENKEMVINFKPKLAHKIRLVKHGTNWDKGNNYVRIKRIELLSNGKRYPRGVFSKLVSLSENHDPHKSRVFISSSDYGFNSFYLANTDGNASTLNKKNSWFQVELIKGLAILTGFSLYRGGTTHKMKSYKVICTDDIKKPIESWITLIEINENTENDHKDHDIYTFDKPSPPVKFVRLLQTGQNWSNNDFLKFFYFDIFGRYINIDVM